MDHVSECNQEDADDAKQQLAGDVASSSAAANAETTNENGEDVEQPDIKTSNSAEESAVPPTEGSSPPDDDTALNVKEKSSGPLQAEEGGHGDYRRDATSDEPPSDELPSDELPSDEPPSDELPRDELPSDELPSDEPTSDELPSDELPSDELPRDELPSDELPRDELPRDELPSDELPSATAEEMSTSYSAEESAVPPAEGSSPPDDDTARNVKEKSSAPLLAEEGGHGDYRRDATRDEPPSDELPSDELPRDELPRDEPPRDEPPRDELPRDELPSDELPSDELPSDELPRDELPRDELPRDELPRDEPPRDELPSDEPPSDEPPRDELPSDEPPSDELPSATAEKITREMHTVEQRAPEAAAPPTCGDREDDHVDGPGEETPDTNSEAGEDDRSDLERQGKDTHENTTLLQPGKAVVETIGPTTQETADAQPAVPVVTSNQGGGRIYLIAACVLGLVLAILWQHLFLPESLTQKDDVRQIDIFLRQLEEVKTRFPNQRAELWSRSKIHLLRHLQTAQPTEPVSLILTAGHRGERTLHCLAQSLASAFSSSLNASVLHIDGAGIASQDSDQVKLDIDSKLQGAFEGDKPVAVINRFDELPPGSTLIFYRYCDHENAAYKKTCLIFTVLLGEEEEIPAETRLSAVEEMVDDHLQKKFLSGAHPVAFDRMDLDKYSGLWSRISHLILPVAAEERIEHDGC